MKSITDREVIPLYSRIAYSLRHKILSGQMEPGSRLPGEEKLAEFYGVSRITLRMALSHLEAEQLISRNRGRGTFVAESIPAHESTLYKRVRDFVLKTQRSTIKPLSIRRIKVGETRIAHDIRSFFDLSNEDEISQIQRILIADGLPRAFFENFMKPELASYISKKDLVQKKAIVRILKDNAQLALGKGEAFLQAMPLDPDIAHALGRQVFDYFIRTQVFLRKANGEPFEIANYFMPAEHFKYKIDLDTTDFE